MARASAKKIDEPRPEQRPIDERELSTILLFRTEVKKAKEKLGALEKRLGEVESDIVLRLRGGARVTGSLLPALVDEEGARRPKWKDEHILHMSEAHGVPPSITEAAIMGKYPAPVRISLVIARRQKGRTP
jgi:hypothetical protein